MNQLKDFKKTLYVRVFFVFCVWMLVGCQHGAMVRESVAPAQHVTLIPQWHLAAKDDTKANPQMPHPQRTNQIAIYDQIVMWVEAGDVQNVVVEGCEGEIGENYPMRFNGWTVADLRALPASEIEPVLTQVGLKLKAKFAERLHVVCGDDLELLKKHQLVFSDLRGLLGFRLRIEEFKREPEKRTSYVATVRSILKLSESNDESAVVSALDREIRAKLDEFDRLIGERNAKFAAAAKALPGRSVIVIGALHVDDLARRTRAAGEDTEVFQPAGLKGDESGLIDQVRGLLKRGSASFRE